MNKEEKIIVILLVALLVAWMTFNKSKAPLPTTVSGTTEAVSPAAATNKSIRVDAAKTNAAETAGAEQRVAVLTAPKTEQTPLLAEQKLVLSNAVMTVTISSRGGAIVSTEFRNFRETVKKDSKPLCLDFSAEPALAVTGIPGVSANSYFTLSGGAPKGFINITGKTDSGLDYFRTITISNSYALSIVDMFSNKCDKSITLPKHSIGLGPMGMTESKAKTQGITYLGLDTLPSAGSADVVYWADAGSRDNKLNLIQRFQPENRQGSGCAMFKPQLSVPLPVSTNVVVSDDTDWIAAKNKFFVQFLSPKGGGNGFILNAKRDVPKSEIPGDPKTWTSAAVLQEVSAGMRFNEVEIQPGESFNRQTAYYVGPKKYSILKTIGNNQEKIMFRAWSGWGWFSSLCVGMLWTLDAIHKVFANYGVAIIILTAIVKFVFWPVTHFSSKNMRKMQEIQPLVTALREKYKSDPKKMNTEVMALYKQYKVNPAMGCIPMLIQVPVFISLFIVLRSAVELRFAEFLWIKDLSEPENLLAGSIPLIGSLNILPLFMTATTIWQQKLTPSSGDPQQQKMMMYMPIIMLFIFYNMPSALVLYWSVSQLFSIMGLIIQRRKKALAPAVVVKR